MSDSVAALRNRTSRSGRASTPAGEHLVDHRGHERLLALDPADVGAVAERVAGAHVVEGLAAADLAGAGRDVDAVRRVDDVLGDADLDAVDGVDHVLEAGEVHDDEVVDEDAGELLELLDRAAGSGQRERLVPHPVGAAGHGVAVLGLAVGTGRPASRAGC